VLDVSDPRAESDLRRRAAWLLVMLVIVAVLFVVLMTVLINGKGHKNTGSGPAALDSYAGTAATRPAQHSSAHSASASTRAATTSTPPPRTRLGCPTAQTCVLEGDVGQGIQAVNAYRSAHGQRPVPGQVGSAAQACALHNGSGCTGGWAETELAKPDGPAAVQKILPFAHLLDPAMRSFQIGWAYDPGAKLYYFAIVRND
jgi:hypothetical protein